MLVGAMAAQQGGMPLIAQSVPRPILLLATAIGGATT